MSQENVGLVYRLNDAFKRRDLDAYLAVCEQDVVYYSRFGEVEGGGPYRGREAARRRWSRAGAAARLLDPHGDYYPADDRVCTAAASRRWGLDELSVDSRLSPSFDT